MKKEKHNYYYRTFEEMVIAQDEWMRYEYSSPIVWGAVFETGSYEKRIVSKIVGECKQRIAGRKVV